MPVQVAKQNVAGLQWISSEAWTCVRGLHTTEFMPYLSGTLGIAIRRGEMPGFQNFLLRLYPPQNTEKKNMVKFKNIKNGRIQITCMFLGFQIHQFWEHTFECRFAPAPEDWVEAGGALCTGHEELQNKDITFLDVSDLRAEYNIYKAVNALAHALDDLLRCEQGRGPFLGNRCAALHTLKPWQVFKLCPVTCHTKDTPSKCILISFEALVLYAECSFFNTIWG